MSGGKHLEGLIISWWTWPITTNLLNFSTMILHKVESFFVIFGLRVNADKLHCISDENIKEWLYNTPKKQQQQQKCIQKFRVHTWNEFANNLFCSQNGTNMFSMHLFIYFFCFYQSKHKRNDQISNARGNMQWNYYVARC